MLVGNGQVSDFLTTSQLVSPPLESMDIGKISLALLNRDTSAKTPLTLRTIINLCHTSIITAWDG